MNKEFVNGFLVGGVQILVGHPLDTLKSNIQKFHKIDWKIFKKNPRQLYRGVTYPLLGNSLINSLYFGLNQHYYTYTYNYYMSGALAGLSAAVVINPLELYPILIGIMDLMPLIYELFSIIE